MRSRSDPSKLSDQELEIADLLAGRSYADIGVELGISERTVKYHVTNMRYRFGANNRNELIAILREKFIID